LRQKLCGEPPCGLAAWLDKSLHTASSCFSTVTSARKMATERTAKRSEAVTMEHSEAALGLMVKGD